MARKSYSSEFKQEAASLVLDQDYTLLSACDSMGVGETAMRRWVNQLRLERNGQTPQNLPTLMSTPMPLTTLVLIILI